MTKAYITARSPVEVAREVELLRRRGYTQFIVTLLHGGAMLDRERLGAARYAAGLQSEVELEDESLSPSREVAAAR